MSYTSGEYAPQARRVLRDNEAFIPINTALAYNSKGMLKSRLHHRILTSFQLKSFWNIASLCTVMIL